MQITRLPYRQTGFFSTLIADYIEESPKVEALYSFPFSYQGLQQAIEYRKTKPVNREALVAVLQNQYAQGGAEASPKTAENIALLKDPTTFTIVTGHQLNLFAGPLYLIHKLINVITLANQLKQQFPQYNFVPVYWMHTEDADIEEINHTYLFNKKILWADAGTGIAGSLSTATLQPVINEVEAILGNSTYAAELVSLIKDAYLNHTNLADAMRYFVNALLGKYGLVILDPNAKELKQAFVDVVADDLLNNSAYKLVSESNKNLINSGYTAQVNPRGVNLFYINNNQRYRLVKTEKDYATAGNEFTFSADEISRLLKEQPEVFSPNVVLRPLYQEVILPNICYVGGGGELAYWLQYKSFFNHYGYELPVLALRSSYMLMDEAQAQKIAKWNVPVANLFLDTDVLIKGYVQSTAGNDVNLAAERSEAAAFFANLATKAKAIDASLSGSIEAENKKLENFLNGLEAKLLKALKAKDEATINQIRKLKESLFPDGSLQERSTNFMQFYIKQGPALFDVIMNNADVMHKEFTVVVVGNQ